MTDAGPRHVFIAGLHRSGTSLLHRSLKSHPCVSGFENTGVPEDEGQHLQTVFPPAAHFGGPGKFGFADDAGLYEYSASVSDENRRKLALQWGRYWDAAKPVLIEKSPPNLIRMRFLQAMFPNSLFIIIVRHPLAQCYATRKWSDADIVELVEHWTVAHRRMLVDLAFVNHWRLMRYEDFVDNPGACLSGLFRWIGLEPSPVVEDVDRQINQKYFARWEKEAWKRPAMARKLRGAQVLANDFGYHFEQPYTRVIPRDSRACPPHSTLATHPARLRRDSAPVRLPMPAGAS